MNPPISPLYTWSSCTILPRSPEEATIPSGVLFGVKEPPMPRMPFALLDAPCLLAVWYDQSISSSSTRPGHLNTSSPLCMYLVINSNSNFNFNSNVNEDTKYVALLLKFIGDVGRRANVREWVIEHVSEKAVGGSNSIDQHTYPVPNLLMIDDMITVIIQNEIHEYFCEDFQCEPVLSAS
jgi:hypothetical protein